MDPSQHLKSLKKGLEALALLNQKEACTVTELSKKLGVPRTTAHRVLETLTAEGYAVRETEGNSYRLTVLVRRLSEGFSEDKWITEIAHPIVHALGEEISWPTAMTTPMADQMLVRVATDHHTPLAIERYYPGALNPIMHTTTGQLYLAFCRDQEREMLLKLIRLSEDPRQQLGHDTQVCNSILGRLRKDKFCIIEYEEYQEGSMGVPVIVNGYACAGLVMRYIKKALNTEELKMHYLPKLVSASQEIAVKMTQQG